MFELLDWMGQGEHMDGMRSKRQWVKTDCIGTVAFRRDKT